jgi:hypothetical protein
MVDSGIGLSYRPSSLCSILGRYDSPMPESTISPSQGLRIWLQAVENISYWNNMLLPRIKWKRWKWYLLTLFLLFIVWSHVMVGGGQGGKELYPLLIPNSQTYYFVEVSRHNLESSRTWGFLYEFRIDPIVIFRGLGEDDSWKKSEAKNLVTLYL